MSRIWTLTGFVIRDLFQSLLGILPLAGAVAFGLIAFEYGMDQPQFMTVAGVGTGVLCLLTALLLASRFNRATSYALIGRLYRRTELLAAVVLGSLAVTTVLALLITVANLLAGRLTLSFPSALWAVPTWAVFWLFMASLALPLSSLASRGGSHLVGYVVTVGMLVVNDQKAWLQSHNLAWAIRAVTTILWPMSTVLSRATEGIHDQAYFAALCLVLAAAVLLFGLAAALFENRDLLWAE